MGRFRHERGEGRGDDLDALLRGLDGVELDDFLIASLGNIEQDRSRFRRILRKTLGGKDKLRRIVGDKELIGRQGKDLVSIPVPELELPNFRFGDGRGGVGQGDGGGEGNKAGDKPGQHIMEAELSIEELVEMIPIKRRKLLPLTGDQVEHFWKMRGITTNRTIKRSFRKSYKRGLEVEAVMAGLEGRAPDAMKAIRYVDWRGIAKFHGWEKLPKPVTNCSVIFIADISGSMDQPKRELERQTAQWIQWILEYHYKSIHKHFVAHDSDAAEVSGKDFYALRAGGGTKVSSGLLEAMRIILANPSRNYYIVDFTDGENFGTEDNRACVEILNKMFGNPYVRMFGYCEIRPGSDRSLKTALKNGVEETNVKYGDDVFGTAKIDNFEEVLQGILDMFGEEKEAERG
jgi:uncharacterized sporulation protein YeaH/YhbH (DUF444 family)